MNSYILPYLKILQLVTRRQYRGAEVFAANLSQELLKRGDQVIFLGLYAPTGEPLQVQGAENNDLSGKSKYFIDFRMLWRLIGLIQREKPAIIQANGSDTLKYAVMAGFFTRKTPLIYRNISMISTWMGTNKLKRTFYRLLFSRVHHVSSVGEFALEDLIVSMGYDRKRTSVIRRGIPIEVIDRNEARAKLSVQFAFPKEDKIVIHIGNFSQEKNHLFILRVFSILHERNKDVRLILVGNGELLPVVRKEIIEQGLEETVFLTGFRTDTGSLLAASDVLTLFSKVEGVPGVVLEAAAQSVPALAVNVGGVSEVVNDKQTGILVNNFSEEIFVKELIKLLGNDTMREELGRNAFKMVKQKFDPQITVNSFRDLYKKLSNVE